MRKGVILLIVLGLVLVLSLLAWITAQFMTQQAYQSEHKIRRIQAFFAAQAGAVHAIEKLRNNQYPSFPVTETIYFGDSTQRYYPYQVTIDVGDIGTGLNNTQLVTATVDYTAP